MNDTKILAVCVIISGVATFVTFGFIFNSSNMTVGHDDIDCRLTSKHGPHDERPEGCYKICETHPVWWNWGSDKDCYWDDEPPKGE